MKSELLTAEEMRDAEKAAIRAGISEEMMMSHAGEGVVEVILKHFAPCRVLAVCGPGKNGGDAQVVTRLLKEMGWDVESLFFSDLPPFEALQKNMKNADLIIDGLLGMGFSRHLEGEMRSLVALMNAAEKPIIAIDIPTGVDMNSGMCDQEAIRATYTVTFLRARPGHFLLPGRLHVGELFVKDIEIPEHLLPAVSCFVNGPSLWRQYLKTPQPYDHKYTRGACLIVGNGSMPGALKLASLAARRVGAGLTRILCKSKEYPILAGTAWGDIVTPVTTAKEFLKWITEERFKALLWGTGALPTASTREQALLLLSTKKPCVLDGGALSSFEKQAQVLAKHLHEKVILTPHEGEFLRLFPHLAFLKNKVQKALKAAVETGAIVVLKGYDTIIASPDGKTIINANAPPTLATAGTGDVLAGLMVGFLAQGLPPFQAAAAAVWIHGEAANRRGLGLIAEDLLGEISAVLQRLSHNDWD